MKAPAPKWVQFDDVTPAGRKTSVWGVWSKDASCYIGKVSWWGAWRCYAFQPRPDTVFEQRCLRDIAYFLRYQMALRRRERASA